jgi:hypothetical protein
MDKRIFISVAKGPKFRPQNTQGADKNCVVPGKFWAELLADLLKKEKTVIFLSENYNLPLICSSFFYYFAS